jgi:hypothetical protein
LTDEAAAVGGGVGVNGHAELVDSNMMVVPAKRYQILWRVVTTVMLFVDVVDL